jgi:outer membrane lipoprotein SlyB
MMIMNMLKTAGASALALIFAASLASAQAPLRVRGTIESVDGANLSVKARDGATMKIKVADGAPVLTLDKKTMADVKPGTFVGITAMPQPDGSQKAVEIHIFPEPMRGTGEGHYPWDLMPNSTMTNANIENQVVSSDGQELVMKYKDGEKKIIVPANIEVVMFAPAAMADIKAGQKFFVPRAKKLDDGTVEAGVIIVSSHGVDPPM